MALDAKPITDTLGELENGEFLRDVTTQLRKVTAAVRETRKPGAITISLKLSPSGRGSIEIDAKIDAKVPEHDRASTMFFLSPDGTLLRDDPTQPKLPLREVPRDAGDLKTISKE